MTELKMINEQCSMKRSQFDDNQAGRRVTQHQLEDRGAFATPFQEILDPSGRPTKAKGARKLREREAGQARIGVPNRGGENSSNVLARDDSNTSLNQKGRIRKFSIFGLDQLAFVLDNVGASLDRFLADPCAANSTLPAQRCALKALSR
jgi:hypothetical protein